MSSCAGCGATIMESVEKPVFDGDNAYHVQCHPGPKLNECPICGVVIYPDELGCGEHRSE